MRGTRLAALALLLAASALSADVVADLAQAKSLYERAQFGEAIELLQGALRRLEAEKASAARTSSLGDAYLHLALAHLGVGDRSDAKEAFRRLLRLEPGRRLDPEIYAPKVLALVEEARAEIAAEPVAAPAAAAPAKGGSTIVIGGAALVAAGGVAVLATSASTHDPASAPPPAAPTLERADLEFASSDPAPGGTIRYSMTVPITVRVWAVYTSGGDFALTVNDLREDGRTGYCLSATVRVGWVVAGEPQLVHVPLQRQPACTAPFEVAAWEVWLRKLPRYDDAVYRVFPLRYRVTP
jgi:hypothetical protein